MTVATLKRRTLREHRAQAANELGEDALSSIARTVFPLWTGRAPEEVVDVVRRVLSGERVGRSVNAFERVRILELSRARAANSAPKPPNNTP
jgi:hypothetical protein